MNTDRTVSSHVGLRALLPSLLLIAALIWLMRDTGAAMVEIWWRSETFTHAFLVPPISLWLAWRQRGAAAGVVLSPAPWALLPIAALCLLWLMGELANVAAASQFALVGIIVLTVPALFGSALTRRFLFPLGFLFFAVPIGEFLVPTMIDHTADFTIAALRLTGIPVYREGNDFVIPSGNWSVVDACSGVRYLIASLMVGTLFAYLNYESSGRRWAFVGVSILVPVVANWLRAYLIVMTGHLSGNTLAVGVDHLIYGWIFFGIVIGLMFMIGARWSQPVSLPPVGGKPLASAGGAGRTWGMALAVLATLGLTQGWLGRLDQFAEAAPQPSLSLPDTMTQGWVADTGVDLDWAPNWINPNASAGRGYRKGDQTVWVWIGYYRQQGLSRKLVASTNSLAGKSSSGWIQTSTGTETVVLGDSTRTLRAGELRQAASLTGASPRRILVWHSYWVDGELTASDAVAKLRQAFARLLGRGDDGAVVMLASTFDGGADAALRGFAKTQMSGLVAQLESVRASANKAD